MDKHDVASLMTDQRRRWQQGDAVLVETYLARYPTLHHNNEDLLDLVYHEMLLREDKGQKVRLNDYLDRFPSLAEDLRRLFVAHKVIFHAPDQPAAGSKNESAANDRGTC
jgi:hypothetical protein